MLSFLTQTTFGVMITSFAVKFILAGIAWGGMRFLLQDLDKTHKFDFNEWISDDKTSDVARGIYFAGRILALALLLGWILS